MKREYVPARRYPRERYPDQNIVGGYQPGPRPSGEKRKKRNGIMIALLPGAMIAFAMTLSLLIVKSDFIASPVYKPMDGATLEGEVRVAAENNPDNGGTTAVSPAKSNKAQDKYLVLVNRDNKLERDYRPGNMVDIQKQVPSLDRQILLDRTAAEAFKSMVQEMEADFASTENSQEESLIAVSGYRTYEYQENLFDKELKENLKTMSPALAEATAARLVALPGSSEHQTGLAIDVTTASMGYKLQEEFQNTAGYAWLKENCAEFGFIIRYPEDKVDITGISHEPWHLRYIGAEHARVIMKDGLTLEEYLKEDA